MKVKLLVGMSGTRDGESWPPRGEVVDLPEDEARTMIHSGMAEPVVDDKTEKAVPPEGEKRSAVTTKSGPTRKA